MARKKEIILPKLPRGMGSYDWKDKAHTTIRYRKQITYNGKTENLSVSGSSIKEVNDLMIQKENETKKMIDLNMTKSVTGTLESKMFDWLELYKLEDLKGKSYDRVESTYLNHISGTDLGRMQEKAITSDHIQQHMKSLKNKRNGEPLSYSSEKKVYELLNQYFTYRYVKEPYMNPMISVTKPKKSDEDIKKECKKEELIIWDDEEMKELSQVAAMPYQNGIEGFKHGLAIVFIMWSFVRIGEGMALRWTDIDFQEETANIHHQFSRVKDRNSPTGKYKWILTTVKYHSRRKFKLNRMAVDALKEYKIRKNVQDDNEYIFYCGYGENKPISYSAIENSYKLMVQTANINHEKNVTIHGLRHSGISYMLRHGVPVEVVSKMAGHKSIKVTLEIYYSVIEKQKNEAIDKLNEEHYIDFITKKED